jgi:hypothetical protein
MTRTLLGFGLVLTGIGLVATNTRRDATGPTADVAPQSVRPTAVPAPTAIDSVLLPATFQPRQLVGGYTQGDKVSLYQVGAVDEDADRYAGGSLLLLRVEGGRGPCKGAGCAGPLYARLIRFGDRLIALPQLSPWGSWLETLLAGGDMGDIFAEDSVANRALLTFLRERGTLETDSETLVQGLAYRRTFTSRGLEFRLTGADEDGSLDSALLRPAFEQEELGWLYTTRADSAPQRVFYYDDSAYHTTDSWGRGVSACWGEECYRTNAFFWFRPDGTYLRYVYTPPFEVGDIRLTGSERLAPEYLYRTRWGCSDDEADYASVVSPTVLGNDHLHRIGSIAGTDDSILGLIQSDDQYVRAFYARYLSQRPTWSYGEQLQLLLFADFTRELPFFFWEDPFGRLIRFTNAAFLPPLTCEPVIYLYPERERRVQVRLGERVHVLSAAPAYRGAWSVRAAPDGSLRGLDARRSYLFWEGMAGLLPRPERGFVVRQSDIEGFFRRTLPRLGLVGSEIEDFLRAWLPVFTEAPYYRIGFYDRATIDAYAPLEVEPVPTTVIRVLFDYQALSAPVPIHAPALPPPPHRDGFTVVEWGGVKR